MYDLNNLSNDIFNEESNPPMAPPTPGTDIEARFVKLVRKELKKHNKKKKKSKKNKKSKKSKHDFSKLIAKVADVSIESGLPLLYANIFNAGTRKRGGGQRD